MGNDTLKISRKTFLTSLLILLALMLLAGILTRTIPQGSFDRVTEAGREVVVAGSYRENPEAETMAFGKVFAAPVMVLFSEDAVTVIGIILFLILISGAIGCLQSSGVMAYAVEKVERRYRGRKYRLLWIVTGLFMLFGSAIGCFEECAALVPMAVALSVGLGWDSLVGLGMSLFAAGFGFSAAMFNPFTLGVAQEMASLPLYSGFWFHALVFVVIYLLLGSYLSRYARRIEKNPEVSYVYREEQQAGGRIRRGDGPVSADPDPEREKGLSCFLAALGLMAVILVCGIFVPAVSDVSLILMAVTLALGGFLAAASIGNKRKAGRAFGKSVVGMLPAVLMILMASSVKWIIAEGGILDTLLYLLSGWTEGTSPAACLLLVYAVVLVMNFFIASGSAKAFLLMPLLVPMADLTGLTRQAVIAAFCFGDGFSNVFYPTNPVLLISLGLTVVSYGKWVKFTWCIQLLVLLVTSALLMLACFVQIGPF